MGYPPFALFKDPYDDAMRLVFGSRRNPVLKNRPVKKPQAVKKRVASGRQR